MAWKEISGDTLVSPGETYRTIITYQRTSGNSSDETMINTLVSSLSYYDLEQQLKQQYGTEVKVLDVTARKVSENIYEQTVEFECISASSPALIIVLALAIALTIAAWFLVDHIIHLADLDAFKIKVGGAEINILPYILIAIVIIILIALLRK